MLASHPTVSGARFKSIFLRQTGKTQVVEFLGANLKQKPSQTVEIHGIHGYNGHGETVKYAGFPANFATHAAFLHPGRQGFDSLSAQSVTSIRAFVSFQCVGSKRTRIGTGRLARVHLRASISVPCGTPHRELPARHVHPFWIRATEPHSRDSLQGVPYNGDATCWR